MHWFKYFRAGPIEANMGTLVNFNYGLYYSQFNIFITLRNSMNMFSRLLYILLFFVMMVPFHAAAQEPDTFFLAKKKGILGRLGKSISTSAPDDSPQKIENQFLKYKGKIIRSIQFVRLGFECSIYDTCEVKNNFGIRMANAFHKNSKEKVISNDLFFKEGSRFYPFLVADNERYLRDLPYIQDARIVVDFAEDSKDSVDVVVLTKDIFSLGAKIKIATRTRGRLELEEENIGGTANRIFLSGLYDEERNPVKGFNAEFTKRNIAGSFIDWTTGFTNFAPSFSSGKREEMNFFTRLEKPLVTPYIPSTGSLEGGYYTTRNAYVADSFYRSDLRYSYYLIDGWFGYSLDSKRSLYANKEIKVHKFIALRGFDRHFFDQPLRYKDSFDYRFTSTNGFLASINIFKQSFYKTNFIYGFGRNEDVPEGFSAVFTTGYAINRNSGYFLKEQIKRPYTGLDFNLTNFKHKGYYNNFTLRAGGFFYRHRFEDLNLLFNLDHFTRLKKLSSKWYHRTFLSAGIAGQVNPVFNTPLLINNDYGLPYFNPDNINADMRSTVKIESVFYNTAKILGFRLAPFIFSDFSLLKPSKADLDKSDLYMAFGGGIRTRNENLVFGTIELKGYYFPRTNGDMNTWKIEVSSNIRFKYISSFIKRPDYVNANY
jgi:hypothetical protein